MKKEIKIGCFFRGSEEHGEELMKAFEEAGGENPRLFTGDCSDLIYYLTQSNEIAAVAYHKLQTIFGLLGPEYEITIGDLREYEDMSRPQFPGIFKVVPCVAFTPLISPEDGEEYAYILTKEQMKTIDKTLNELL